MLFLGSASFLTAPSPALRGPYQPASPPLLSYKDAHTLQKNRIAESRTEGSSISQLASPRKSQQLDMTLKGPTDNHGGNISASYVTHINREESMRIENEQRVDTPKCHARRRNEAESMLAQNIATEEVDLIDRDYIECALYEARKQRRNRREQKNRLKGRGP